MPMSAVRYQQLLNWMHEGRDLSNINGDDLPSILLSYEQVLAGVFALRDDIEAIPNYFRDGHGAYSADAYRTEVLAIMDKRLRKTFGMEED